MTNDYSAMRTDLYNLELLRGMANNLYSGSGLSYVPPYGNPPWNYEGTEGANLSFFYGEQNTITGEYIEYKPTDVDWILVSLRSSIEKSSEVFAFAAILTDDGIIRLDEPITQICDIGEGPFYIVVEHRNHLPAMSHEPVEIENGALYYDFTMQNSYSISNPGQKQLPNGKWAAFAGNCSQQSTDANPQYDRNDIFGLDRTLWKDDNGGFRIYISTDMNLDGDLTGADKALWFNNFGINSGVPQ